LLTGLEGFIERYGHEAPEVVWLAACAWLERAAETAKEVPFSRLKWYPNGELGRLRRDMAAGLQLARFAVALQEEENEAMREMGAALHEVAAEEAKKRRREQTAPAQRARLAKAAKRKGQP
jgi:hypothetical protein